MEAKRNYQSTLSSVKHGGEGARVLDKYVAAIHVKFNEMANATHRGTGSRIPPLPRAEFGRLTLE